MTDYISREAAKEHLLKEYPLLQKERLVQAIASIPTADVRENKRGKWITTFEEYVCSECMQVRKFVEYGKKTNFCPNCGSDNREEQT